MTSSYHHFKIKSDGASVYWNLLPYWNLPLANQLVSRLRRFFGNLDTILKECIAGNRKRFVNKVFAAMENPSGLRFIEGSCFQAAQKTMLIAGHQTAAAELTWAMFELTQQPKLMVRVQKHIDEVDCERDP